MRIAYGARSYRRDQFPELRLLNMFAESTPSDETGVALLSRKGLSELATRGAGPITGVFSQANVFSGDVFVVSGGTLYRGATSIGAIAGSGPVTMAGRSGELLITAGGPLYSYDGATLAAVAFPDSANVRSIDFHDGLFLAVRDATHKYYWSAVNDGRTWDALDFASAESKPDNLLDIRVINDTLILFGEETIEPWSNVGDAAAPYQRQELRIYSKGLKATGAVTEVDQSLYFVSNDNMVCILGDGPQRISDHDIEQRIAASATARLFCEIGEGHSFVILRLASETWAYDIATREWHERGTGGGNYQAQCSNRAGTTFGSSTNGKVYTLSGWADDGVELERLFTAAVPLEDNPLIIDNVRLHANVGKSTVLTGQGSNPTIAMRLSRDASNTWTDWNEVGLGNATLGGTGEYRTRPKWRRLGMFDAPGAMLQFRVTDPVPVRVSGVFVNEPGGGRSR